MKSINSLVLLSAGASAAAVSSTSYAQLLTDSVIRRGVTPSFHYSQATLYTGLESVYDLTGNSTLLDFYRDQVDALVSENGTIASYIYTKHSLDNYRLGNNLLWWYERTGEEKFKIAATDIKTLLDSHPRTPTGGFWHRDPTYPNQMWLDGIYMADSFYAKYVKLFQPNNQTAWDDIALQFDKIDIITRKDNNLLLHGYDESKVAVWADPETGAAPLLWARADGWYFMSLLEVISHFPKSHPARKRFLNYFKGQAKGLKAAQDETGGWWNVMDKEYEDVEGNYIESSASAMFAFGLIRGINQGILDKKTYASAAKTAYKSLVKDFITSNDDGTINFEGTVEVGSLGSNATFTYYSSIGVVQNDLRGIGSFLVAAKEWETRKF
ncbi:glycosyl hydrolase [Dactylonectria estremocensis]|uniref:Glycosyl hydrolase n=1 Tax=Dactylonectria estremocensis TaxID=1079267 RepID=A0A9P9JB30_9HYPO|nr:glycosyl hydrolase [Dactylonectria estremocensis]